MTGGARAAGERKKDGFGGILIWCGSQALRHNAGMMENAPADIAALEFANEAFYQAFANADMAAMDAIWANRPNVFCNHPGWAPLTSRDEVMASWRDILGEGRPIPISCRLPRASPFGETGLVCCFEQFGNQYLVATNLFLRENGLWRMVHHHAGPLARVPEDLAVAEQPSKH
jgi:hypothetical protein